MAKTNVINFMTNVDQRSWIHKLDPRTKVFLIVFFSFMPFIFGDLKFLFIYIGICIILWITAKIDYRSMSGPFIGVGAFLLIIFLLNALRTPAELTNPDPSAAYTWYISLGPLVATSASITRAAFYALRLLCPMTIGLLVISTTDPTMLCKGLRMLKMPSSVSFMLLSGLRFIPIVMEQLFIILDAQTIRGVKGSRITRTQLVLFPLFITSLRRARTMGLACEAKGFGAGKWNHFFEYFKFRFADKAVIASLIVFTIAGFVLRFGFGIGLPLTQGGV
jgi:energy-coupling factor transport system permease protein